MATKKFCHEKSAELGHGCAAGLGQLGYTAVPLLVLLQQL